MNLKVIFLDYDGVLNREDTDYIRGHDDHDITITDGLPLRRSLCAKVNTILESTGAKLIISSAWRHNFSDEQAQNMLVKSGITLADIIGKTKRYGHRGTEIEFWLSHWKKENKPNIDRWVILDDRDWMLAEQAPFFVKTKRWVGIDDADVKQVVEILNGSS